MIVGAWLTIVIAQASGNAGALHHHAQIEGGTPPGLAILAFLIAWQVMVVAMMWPASLPALRAFRDGSGGLARPRRAVATFLGTFAIVWATFGLAAFFGDVALHHLVDTTPWLAARPWVIEAAVLAVGGGYQFTSLKWRCLSACRRPAERTTSTELAGTSAVRHGFHHGLDCLGSSWALMLVMFATGFANTWSMAALTLLMVYEVMGVHGQRVARAAGIALVLAGLTALWGPFPGSA
jgi:predicted metal-binding membrane protein